MPPDASPPAADRLLAGRYELRRELDRGGMAEVWQGHDSVLARPVAVKTLHPHLASAEEFLERFRREAVAAARLTHPGIVATFDTGTDAGTAFIVMELVQGQPLREVMARGRLPIADAVAIAFQVADALEHAHRNGVVHRDIKPANVLVCDEPGHLGPRVKVSDFGIAKLADSLLGDEGAGLDLTEPGAVVGTAKYVSPEQVEGVEPDARSDVYALGCVLYEMLCGEAPFVGPTDLATAMRHVRDQATPPRSLCKDIPPALEAVVLRAMAKQPSDRYQSAAEMASALAETGVIDDARPLVSFDARTPAAGIRPAPRTRRSSRGPALVVGALTLATLAVMGFLLQSEGRGARDLDIATRSGGDRVTVARVTTFDPPPGDGSENDDRAALAIDGDPETSWATDRYQVASFGFKKGVGLVLHLASPVEVDELVLTTERAGWNAEVYVAARPATQLTDWGTPLEARSGGLTTDRFDLQGKRAGAVMLWITNLGPARRFAVSEVSVTAR